MDIINILFECVSQRITANEHITDIIHKFNIISPNSLTYLNFNSPNLLNGKNRH